MLRKRGREEFVNEFRNKIIPCKNRSRGLFFKPNPGCSLEGKWEKHKLNRRTWDVRELHRRSDLVENNRLWDVGLLYMSKKLLVLNKAYVDHCLNLKVVRDLVIQQKVVGLVVVDPIAPPSPDYIPGPEEPQTPPVPQDEDEREPMFIQPHDPDYVPEPIYPEYIPLEDEHEFLAEEQPLPPVDSPTAESPGYVAESDPEEDPEEYEDDETEDGPVDYPMDRGEDGDDDDGDSSGDDADDEDGDEEDEDKEDEEEEEEHLALADSAIVVPIVEPVSPPEGTKPVIPPSSTDISTTGARITVRLQASISLPPEG
ncbi:hypothetical protein Tco_0010518 [Tanacetum coccineum]